ncbi:MAG: DUF4091 domain-containing protein [Armatimonadetes bacterium]|nr:DUF4091 domain-containing protein [Armatimonadota bacterium]
MRGVIVYPYLRVVRCLLLGAVWLLGVTGASASGKLNVQKVDAPKTLGPGETIRVSVKWRVDEVPDGRWTTVMELLHLPSGPKFSSALTYSAATEQSKVGDIIQHTYELTVPLDAPPGDYNLRIEHYRRAGEGWDRMPNTNEDADLKGFVYAHYTLGVKEATTAGLKVVSLLDSKPQIKVDGKLDEASWKKATRLAGFVNPTGQGKPTQQTQVLLLRDGKTVFFGFRCLEDRMAKLKDLTADRDGGVWNDDCIEIFLDTNRSRAVYFHFIVNARGTQYDALTEDRLWNGKWSAATAREANAWTCEVALPVSEVGVPAVTDGDSWFVNFCREEKPRGELSCWSATGSSSFGAPGSFGRLIFGSFTGYLNRAREELRAQVQGLSTEVNGLKDRKLIESVAALGKDLDAFHPSATTSEKYQTEQKALETLRERKEGLAAAKLKAALGGEEYVIWERNPWLNFPPKIPISEISGETKTLSVSMLRNATESRALMVTNLTNETLVGRILLGGTPQPQVLVPTFVRTADGRVTADALPPADEIRKLEIPPGETRQLFLNFCTRDVAVGEYHLTIAFSPLTVSKKEKSVEVIMKVLPPRLPEVVPESVFGWDTLDVKSLEEEYVKTLAGRRFNAFMLLSCRLRPHYAGQTDFFMMFGTDQNKPGLDFTEFDQILRLKKSLGGPGARFYVVVAGVEQRGNAEQVKPYMEGWGTAAWVATFKQSVLSVRDHLLAAGLTYSDFWLNPMDESLNDQYLKMATWIKEADPKLLVVSDCVGEPGQAQAVASVTDVWCPHYNAFVSEASKPSIEFMRSTGKPIWMYYYSEGANEKARPAYRDYLVRHWFTFQQGLTGTCYWTVSSHYGDPWNRHTTTSAYDPSLLYPGATAAISSRRLEAWRQGAEDFALLSLVRDSLAQVKDKDAALKQRAEALLKEAVDTVVKRSGDPKVAEAYRERLALLLADIEVRR